MKTFDEIIKEKITEVNTLKQKRQQMALMQKTVVFTNGCFDLLHYGHADYLAKARSLGDVLIVGVNTDASVSRLKGTGRPVQDEKSRCMVLASMLCVDYVVLFDEDTPYNLIQSLQPDVLVKGADYKPQDIVGYDIVTANNGRVQTIEFAQGYSTSAIIDKILTTK